MDYKWRNYKFTTKLCILALAFLTSFGAAFTTYMLSRNDWISLIVAPFTFAIAMLFRHFIGNAIEPSES